MGLVHDAFGSFSVHQGNFAEIEMRLTWAWYQVVASKVQHRAGFHGLWQVDVPATRRALAALAPDDQALLRFGLTGGLFTEAYKAKWTDQTDVCRWCGERDTLQHRYWECIQHADLRASHAADAAKVWTSLPPALSLRGWALLPPTWQSWISALAGLPTEVVPPSGSFRRGVWNDVFTDGSCLWQAQVSYRVASWAVVLAAPFQPSWTPEMAVVLHASALSGVCQTAFRAELAAVAYVLHWAAQTGTAVRVWTDCLGVVNKVKLMCNGRFRLGVNRPNSDLWIWIAASLDDLGVDRVQIRKVAAHRTLQSARTADEMWQFFHNGYVDKAARLANQARPEKFWKLWEQHVQATQTAQKLVSQVQALHVAIGRRHVLSEEEAERVTDVTQRSTRQFEMQFSLGRWFGHALPDSSRLFGATHVSRVVQWFTERIRDTSVGDLRWVSFAQLYLDFQMCWGLPGPLRVQNLWVDISMRPHLTTTGFSFKQQVKWFRQLLKSVWKEASAHIAMEQCRPHSSMVQAFVQCASLPWAPFALHTVDNWLAANLLQPCTRNAGALLRLPAPPKCQEMAI
jgi:ribonuclease HI